MEGLENRYHNLNKYDIISMTDKPREVLRVNSFFHPLNLK